MTVFVIGGTNFIGPYVVRALIEQGHSVTVFHRGHTQADLPPSVQHLYGDRAQLHRFQADIDKVAPDIVLDMVAYTETDAQSVIDVFKDRAHRAVIISSMDVYRARDILWNVESGRLDPVPLTESSPLRSQLYPFRELPELRSEIPADYEKILVERTYQNEPQLPVTILRLPMVYGPGDYQHRFLGYLQRMDDHRPAIVLESSIANWRGCYGYVENVAAAIALAVSDERAAGRTYNIAEPDSLSEAEWIQTIGEHVGWGGKVISLPAEQMPETWQVPFNSEQHWIADSARIRHELVYSEKITRDEALRRTIAWERTADSANFTPSLDLLAYGEEDELLKHL